jgi:WD40 repeat protein
VFAVWVQNSTVFPILTLDSHSDTVETLAFSADGSVLASGSSDRTCFVYNLESKQVCWILGPDATPVQSISFSPTRPLLAVASGVGDPPNSGTGYGPNNSVKIRVCDIMTGMVEVGLREHRFAVRSLSFSPDGTYLATTNKEGGIWLWETRTWRHIETIDGSGTAISRVVFSPSGTLLATISSSEVSVWQLSPVSCLWSSQQNHLATITSLAFSPDGKILATGSQDRTVRLWETFTGKMFDVLHCNMEVKCVAFSPQGDFLAIGTYAFPLSSYPYHPLVHGNATLWDLTKRLRVKIFTGHYQGVMSLAFSPDSQFLATGDVAGAVRIWRLTQ